MGCTSRTGGWQAFFFVNSHLKFLKPENPPNSDCTVLVVEASCGIRTRLVHRLEQALVLRHLHRLE